MVLPKTCHNLHLRGDTYVPRLKLADASRCKMGPRTRVSNGSGHPFWLVTRHAKRLSGAGTTQHYSELGWHSPKERIVLGLKKQSACPPWSLGPFKFHFLLFIIYEMFITSLSTIINHLLLIFSYVKYL